MVVQTRKRKAAQEQAAREAASAEGSPKRQKLPVRSKDDEKAEAETAAKGTLITFGDDDEVKNETTAPAPSSAKAGPSVEEVQGEESDDDAAPEAVSTAQVASDMKKSAQAAQKAAREQAAAEKRRRQERDALLKKQAEERKEAERAAAAAESLSAPDGDDKDGASLPRRPEPAGRRRRTDKAPVPDLLPAELLTDSASEGEDEGAQEGGVESGARRPRQRKISAVEASLARQARGPQDERVGSTVYRVAAKVDERLPPKARKYAKSSKEVLLRRDRTAVKSRPGFFTR